MNSGPSRPRPPRADWDEYVWVVAVVFALTEGALLLPARYYVSVGLLYLLAIILLSLRVGRWPMLLAGLLSALSWEYFFMEPRFQFRIYHLQDALMLSIYIVVALVAGQLTARTREQARKERLGEEREQLLRTLLDSVSHELRTPLAVISASLENLEAAPPSVQANLITETRTAAHRLNRVVRNLLDQTRLESGHLKPRLDWCDPHDLINAALESVADAIAGRPFTLAVPEDMPPVRVDFKLMEHALANLLLNVARHTPEGTPIFLTAGIYDGGRRAFFTVADRGSGLPAEIRDHAFGKFVRGSGAASGGLGLGLSIVHGFVAAQGGELNYQENTGGGALFTIYVPHAMPQPEPRE